MKRLLILFVAAVMAAGAMAEENDLSAKVFQKGYSDVKIVFTNHSDTTIKSAEIRLFYYDEQGNQFHYQDENVSINVEPKLSITKEIHIDDVAQGGSVNVTVQVKSYTFKGQNGLTAMRLGSLFGNTDDGLKGNPAGHGSSAGNSWSLSGRGIKGSLPQTSNKFNQEGHVIVEVRVNAKGDVISAVHKGGTISDKKTIKLALDAARKAKFTEGDNDQIGTITYNFKFN